MGKFIFNFLLFAFGMYLLSLCVLAADDKIENNYWKWFGDNRIVEDLWVYRWSINFVENLINNLVW